MDISRLSTANQVVPTAYDQDGHFLVVHAERKDDWTVTTTTDRYESVYKARMAWDFLYMKYRFRPPLTAWLLTPRPDTNRLELELLQRELGVLPTANLSSTRPLRGDLEQEQKQDVT